MVRVTMSCAVGATAKYIFWARTSDLRDLEISLARSRHQKIARPSRDCSGNLEMELLQLTMISIKES